MQKGPSSYCHWDQWVSQASFYYSLLFPLFVCAIRSRINFLRGSIHSTSYCTCRRVSPSPASSFYIILTNPTTTTLHTYSLLPTRSTFLHSLLPFTYSHIDLSSFYNFKLNEDVGFTLTPPQCQILRIPSGDQFLTSAFIEGVIER